MTCHQSVSVTHASLLYFVALHIAHLNPCPKQPQQSHNKHAKTHINKHHINKPHTTHNVVTEQVEEARDQLVKPWATEVIECMEEDSGNRERGEEREESRSLKIR